MRLPAFFITAVFGAFAALPSCHKSKDVYKKVQTETPTIKKGDTFRYNFGLLGIEDGVGITKQAAHFDISTVARDSTGHVIYTYKANPDYIGTDIVELTYYMSIGGPPVDSSKTTFKITVVP